MSNRCRTKRPRLVKIEAADLIEPTTESGNNQAPSKLPAELKRIADHNAIGVKYKEAPARPKRKSRKPKALTYDNDGCIVLDDDDDDEDLSDTEPVAIKNEEDLLEVAKVPVKKEEDLTDVCKPAACKTAAAPKRGWAWLVAKDGSPIVFDCAQQAEMTKTMRKRLLESHGAATTGRKKPKIESLQTRTGAVDSEEEYSSCSNNEEYNSDRSDDEDDDNDNLQFSTYAERLQAHWDAKFDLLVKYKKKHKTANVPRRTKILGDWVQTQRRSYKAGTLEKERIAQLESIGFEWELVGRPEWVAMYKRLVAYKKKHKTTCVPQRAPKLGRWVQKQRWKYKKGTLDKERIAQLESIGFEWELFKRTDWMVMYKCLVAYKKKHKTTCVLPARASKLGCWVQRQRWKYKKGTLDKERIAQLESIGFGWELKKETDWMVMYKRLVIFKKKHNSTCVPRNWKKDPQLGMWVSTQRKRCKKTDRVDLLNKIGFDWKPSKKLKIDSAPILTGSVNSDKEYSSCSSDEEYSSDRSDDEDDDGNLESPMYVERWRAQWDAKFDLLVKYKKKHKTANVPRRTKILGDWVQTQRQSYKRGTLGKKRIACLQSIGFEWELVARPEWVTMYKRLVAYKKKHKTTCVPKRASKLGRWVEKQRWKYKKGTLDKERIAQLKSIGFEWKPSDKVKNHWLLMYKRLIAYKKENNSTCVPRNWKKDPQLGIWVSTQRMRCKEKDRVDLLNKIGFEWKPLKKTKIESPPSTAGSVDSDEGYSSGSSDEEYSSDRSEHDDDDDILQPTTDSHRTQWEEKWNKKFDLLVKYNKKHKTANVPRRAKILGGWVQQQRWRYKRGKLGKERIARLESIGFEWELKKKPPEWIEMYKCLVAYKKKYSSTCVPLNWKKNPQLGRWVAKQRICCKQKDRVDLLNKIGFEWKPSLKIKNEWMEMYKRLVAYKKKHNNTCVPQRWEEDPQLSIWVCSQRMRCKEKDQVDLLNKIGFEWKPFDNQWMVMYKRLMAYKKKHNTTSVLTKDTQLRNWVHAQRMRCKEKDRVDLLNKIGFEWKPHDNQWMAMYKRLMAYKKKHNTTCVPHRCKEDPQLGLWVHTQRSCCKEKDRVDLLNKIGFEWKPSVEVKNRWMILYKRLVVYKKKYNSTRVPYMWKKDPQLSIWVRSQRICCKEKDRIDLLNSIDFAWDCRK